FHLHFLSLIAWATASAALVNAQVRFADFGPSAEGKTANPNITFEEAKEQADLRHGTRVSLKLKNGETVAGHIVRLDAATNRLYIRTTPGHAAVAIDEKDISKMNKATRRAESILPASFGGSAWRDLPGGLQENENGVLRI